MSIEGIQQNIFHPTGSQSVPQGSSAAEGTFMGHAVTAAESPESLLADAAEELSFAADTTDKFALNERKERRTLDTADKLMKLYRVMMQQAGKGEKMQQALASLKRAADRQVMRGALLGAFPDVTDAWAALQEAMESFEGDPEVSAAQRREIRALADAFMQENGEAIRLGLQGAVSGRDFPELGDADATKALYRQTVGEFSSVNEVFSEIQKKYGADFDRAMDFLFSAISSDIESEVPSMGRSHLESVHQKLGLVRLTQSAYRLCEDVMNRWRDVHGQTAALSAMDLLGAVVGLRDRSFVSSSQINEICARARPADIEHEVLFLQELLGAVRKFPDALFEDDRNRATVLDAVQQAVDDAVDREDEYLAGLE